MYDRTTEKYRRPIDDDCSCLHRMSVSKNQKLGTLYTREAASLMKEPSHRRTGASYSTCKRLPLRVTKLKEVMLVDFTVEL